MSSEPYGLSTVGNVDRLWKLYDQRRAELDPTYQTSPPCDFATRLVVPFQLPELQPGDPQALEVAVAESIDQALRWRPGSALAVLAGDDPTPLTEETR